MNWYKLFLVILEVWSAWSECEANCTRGVKRRWSLCGLENCTGEQLEEETQDCNTWSLDTDKCDSKIFKHTPTKKTISGSSYIDNFF